jgi:hypothetical protein
MLNKTIVLDASALYPAPLRDLLMHVALAGLFKAKWTDKIHEEWINAVLRQRPDLKRAQLERTRALMNQAVLDAMIDDFDKEIAELAGLLPDPGDVHVAAAAIKADTEIILTFNLKHFPAAALAPYGIQAMHPDAFLSGLLEAAPAEMRGAMKAHRQTLKNPPKTAEEYFGTLEAQGLLKTVAAARALELEI